MNHRLLAAMASAWLVTGSATALAAPTTNHVQQLLSHDAVRQKASGGLPLVFAPRMAADGQHRLPAMSSAPVAVRIAGAADGPMLATLEASGLRIARRANGEARTIRRGDGHTVVLGHAGKHDIIMLAQLPEVLRIGLDGPPLGVLPPLEVTAPEVNAPDVWRSYDNLNRPITGEGIRVCDSDFGIDIFHPSFFFPDGGYFAWIDANENGVFDMGIDGIDANGDGVVEPLSVLNSIIRSYFSSQPLFGSDDPSYQVGLDWLYWDQNGNGTRDHGREAGFDDSSPGFGELMLVLDDVNGNGVIDVGEKLVALGTSKVPIARYAGDIYTRGVNLIDLPRDNAVSHGTSSAGVIAAGHFGLTRMTGIAPGAELVIAARGPDDPDLLQLADFCLENDARVMLHEYAPWYGYHLDGSSDMEALIDASSAQGVAHVNPAGNLSTSNKGYKRQHPAGQTTTIEFTAEVFQTPYRYFLGTVLWRDPNRPISATIEDPNGNTVQLPDSGAQFELIDGTIAVYAEREVSSRGTVMLNVHVYDNEEPGGPILDGIYQLHMTDGDPTAAPLEVVAFALDDVSGWSQGIHFDQYVSEDHLIGWPGTADQGIAVAAYTGTGHRHGTPGERAIYSGRGYRIDGVEILSLSAPADPIVASYFPDGEARYAIFSGTSGSSPHVAGAAALLLQHTPEMTGEQVRQALRDGALADSVVGTVPNHDWGYGKLRAFDSLYGVEPGPNTAPTITAIETEVSIGAASLSVTASDAEDGPADLRIEIDQDYDGSYDAVATDGVVPVSFDAEGVYISKLRVTDSGGLTATTLAKLTVVAPVDSPEQPPEDGEGGCGCNLPGGNPTTPWQLLLGMPLLGVALRRRS